ncbi:MAG: hypothetical protein AB8F95_12625 [Bacteroidia bacterium]
MSRTANLLLVLTVCLFVTACQQASTDEAVLERASAQLSAANSWTTRASLELTQSLRDSLFQYNDSLGQLEKLRITEKQIREALDRLETDMLILDRVVDGKKDQDEKSTILAYWENDNRLDKLSNLWSSSFELLLEGKSDSTNRFSSNDPAYWQSLIAHPRAKYQQTVLQGAALDLNVAYLNWLEALRQSYDLPPYPEHRLKLVIAPHSRDLSAGAYFDADAWISSVINIPNLDYDGTGVSMDSAWMYEARVHVLAGEDTLRNRSSWMQPFEVNTRFFKADGEERQFQIKDSFKVSRPAVRWYGQRPRYRNCAHRFRVEVLRLGSDFIPSFEISDGEIVADQDSAIFLLRPGGSEVRVDVFQEGTDRSVLLDTFRFDCVGPPMPHFVLLVNGQPYDGFASIPKRSRLVLQLLGDPEFASKYPEDARYAIEKVEVLIQQKPDDPPRSILAFSGRGRSGSQGVPIMLDQSPVPLPPGTLLHIRAEGISRRNYKGDFYKESRFTERGRSLSVVLR